MSSLIKPIKGTAKRTKAARLRAKRAMHADYRRQCFERDKGRCRACYTQDLRLECGDPFLVAHAHHIVYRSRGGQDDLSNLCILCARCHENEHQKRLSITGNPNGTLVFREYAKWTRELLRKWESPA